MIQNELKRRLPPSFTERFPPHRDLAYAAITIIPTLPPVQRRRVTIAFAEALQMVWRVLAGVAIAGLVSCIGMREVAMSEEVDERFALEGEGKGKGGGLAARARVGVGIGEEEEDVERGGGGEGGGLEERVEDLKMVVMVVKGGGEVGEVGVVRAEVKTTER